MSNDLVYRTAREWREADGGTLFGGFARVLQPSPGSLTYHAVKRVRSNAATQFTPPRKHVEPTPEKTPAYSRPRWTQERIDALPRTSGSLTRIGDSIVSGRNNNPYVRCKCTDGGPACAGEILIAASVYASERRPRSCKPCCQARRRRTMAFTDKGYEHGREYAEAERSRAA